MLLAHAKSALNAVEFHVNYYYPLPASQSNAGLLIYREDEYDFVFAFLKERPLPEPPRTSIFNLDESGFHWTCPDRLTEAFQNLEITLEQVVQDWEIFKTGTGVLPSNFKPLSVFDLEKRFPLEQITLNPLNKTLFPQEMPLKSIDILKSIFFKDYYQGIWVLTRTNISTIYLIQMTYSKESKLIHPYSEIFTFNELAMNYFPDFFATDEWEELTLAQLIQLKNLLLHLNSNTETKVPQNVFNTLPLAEVQNWMNPNNYYEFDLF